MDTLVIAVPRRRMVGLLALVVLLAVVAAQSDPAGLLLALPAALGVLALVARDLRSGPVLRAGPAGLTVLQGLRRVSGGWEDVDGLRVVRDRRTQVLELEVGGTLIVLTGGRLGRPPADVLAELVQIRAAAATR